MLSDFCAFRQLVEVPRKFSGTGAVPQSPLAKKMQSRSQWDGAGILNGVVDLTLGRVDPELPASGAADARTVSRIDSVNINAVTDDAVRASEAKMEIDNLRSGISRTEAILSNDLLVSKLPDKGENLRRKVDSLKAKLQELLSKEFTSPTRSYDRYLEAYKSNYKL